MIVMEIENEILEESKQTNSAKQQIHHIAANLRIKTQINHLLTASDQESEDKMEKTHQTKSIGKILSSTPINTEDTNNEGNKPIRAFSTPNIKKAKINQYLRQQTKPKTQSKFHKDPTMAKSITITMMQINKSNAELARYSDQINNILTKYKPNLLVVNELNLELKDTVTLYSFPNYTLETDNLLKTDKIARTGILIRKDTVYKRRRDLEAPGI